MYKNECLSVRPLFTPKGWTDRDGIWHKDRLTSEKKIGYSKKDNLEIRPEEVLKQGFLELRLTFLFINGCFWF